LVIGLGLGGSGALVTLENGNIPEGDPCNDLTPFPSTAGLVGASSAVINGELRVCGGFTSVPGMVGIKWFASCAIKC